MCCSKTGGWLRWLRCFFRTCKYPTFLEFSFSNSLGLPPSVIYVLCPFDQRAPGFLPVVVCTEPYAAELQELPRKPGPNRPLVMIETIPECTNTFWLIRPTCVSGRVSTERGASRRWWLPTSTTASCGRPPDTGSTTARTCSPLR